MSGFGFVEKKIGVNIALLESLSLGGMKAGIYLMGRLKDSAG
jgi:hypothetical protein